VPEVRSHFHTSVGRTYKACSLRPKSSKRLGPEYSMSAAATYGGQGRVDLVVRQRYASVEKAWWLVEALRDFEDP